MGRLTNDESKRSERTEGKTRTKKRKRKKDLEDLHRKVLKARKSLPKQSRVGHGTWQNNFIQILNGLADKREEYDKKTKIGKHKICERILPNPLTYVYRNTADGKSVRRTQTQLVRQKLSNAREKEGVSKRANGDANVTSIVAKASGNRISENAFADSLIKNILQGTPSEDDCSPVLGETEGKKYFVINERQKNVNALENDESDAHASSKPNSSNLDNYRTSAINRYEELCNAISSESFADSDFLKLQVPEPLSDVKKYLRAVYADTFRSQYLRDIIKRGMILDEQELPNISPVNGFRHTEVTSLPIVRGENTPSSSASKENAKQFDSNGERRAENRSCVDSTSVQNASSNNEENVASVILRNRLLFDPAIKNTASENVESEKDAASRALQEGSTSKTNKCDNASLEGNYDPTSVPYFARYGRELVNREDILSRYLRDAQRARRLNEFSVQSEDSCLRLPFAEELANDRGRNRSQATRREDRCSRFVSLLNGKSGNVAKFNLKSSRKNGTKTSKYIPMILRRHNDVTGGVFADVNNCANLIDEVANCENKSRGVLFNVPPRDVVFTREDEVPEGLDNAETPSVVNAIFNRSEMKNMKAQLVQTCDGDSHVPSPDLTGNQLEFLEDCCLQSFRPPRRYNACNLDIPDDVFVRSRVGRLEGATDARTEPCTCVHSKNVQANEPKNDVESFQTLSKAHRVGHQYCCPRLPENCHRQFHFIDPPPEETRNRRRFLLDDFLPADVPNVNRSKTCDGLKSQSVHVQRKLAPVSHTFVCGEGTLKHASDQGNEKLYYSANRCSCLPTSNGTKAVHANPRPSKNLHVLCQDRLLNGVQNLQILSMDERKLCTEDYRCSKKPVIGNAASQPIKYLAYENGTETQRIPIFIQRKDDETAPNVKLINLKNCRDAFAQKSTKNVLMVPRYRKVYRKGDAANPTNVMFEECLQPRQSVLCHSECQNSVNPTNVCGIHGANESLTTADSEPATSECQLQYEENVRSLQRGRVNWQDARHHSNSEYTLVGKSYKKNQTVFYGK